MKLTFFCFGVQLMGDQTLQYSTNVVQMVLQGVGINEDIVNIDYDVTVQHVPEHVVDERLKDRRTVGQAEGHHPVFIVPSRRGEGGLPLITLPDAN